MKKKKEFIVAIPNTLLREVDAILLTVTKEAKKKIFKKDSK
jgi:hypothetical protein